MDYQMFSTIEEFEANNKLLRKNSQTVNRNYDKASEQELDLVRNLYISYLKTPQEFFDIGIKKYNISYDEKKPGTMFLLIVLGTNKFKSEAKKWDARRYYDWAKILNYVINSGMTIKEYDSTISNKRKGTILTMINNKGIVNPNNPKTRRDVNSILRTNKQQEVLIYIDDAGNVIQLPKEAIDLLKLEDYLV